MASLSVQAFGARSPGAALRFGSPSSADDGSVQWLLRRNCSMTPLQLVAFYLSLCAWSLAHATAGVTIRAATQTDLNRLRCAFIYLSPPARLIVAPHVIVVRHHLRSTAHLWRPQSCWARSGVHYLSFKFHF